MRTKNQISLMVIVAIFFFAVLNSISITLCNLSTTQSIRIQQGFIIGTYALIVAGTGDPDEAPIWHRCDYMYNTLYMRSYVWECRYLTINGSFDGYATKNAMLSWLTDRALYLGPYDTLLFFYSGHGGGMDRDGVIHNADGAVDLIDYSGDEGAEHWNGASGTWYGVDECLGLLHNPDDSSTWEFIFDDEIATALEPAVCRVVVILNACRNMDEQGNTTLSCFTGGFIDDLSGFRRCIISTSNETWYGNWHSSEVRKGFAYYLIEAIGWNYNLKDAFEYAFEHDEWRHYEVYPDPNLHCEETPWMDDDGDCLPNYKDGQDYLDDSQGKFASTIHLWGTYPNGFLFGDLTFNGIVNVGDGALIGAFFGKDAYEDPRVRKYVISRDYYMIIDVNGDWYCDISDGALVAAHWREQNPDLALH
jgi:hypothetical protein